MDTLLVFTGDLLGLGDARMLSAGGPDKPDKNDPGNV
jgi:hypothetical protein